MSYILGIIDPDTTFTLRQLCARGWTAKRINKHLNQARVGSYSIHEFWGKCGADTCYDQAKVKQQEKIRCAIDVEFKQKLTLCLLTNDWQKRGYPWD